MPTYTNTTRLGLRTPQANQKINDFTAIVDALGQDVDADTTGWLTGTFAGMSPAGKAGRLYFATDAPSSGGGLYFDTGSAWLPVPLETGGSVVVTWPGGTNVSSLQTITHGLPGVPRVIEATPGLSNGHSPVHSLATPRNITSTTFQVEAYAIEGTPANTDIATVWWLARL